MSRVIVRMVPGTRGVCQHFFVHDPAGLGQTPAGAVGPFPYPGSRGYIACRPQGSQVTGRADQGGAYHHVCHTNEARAVTCPECRATEEWKKTMAEIESLLDTARAGMAQER